MGPAHLYNVKLLGTSGPGRDPFVTKTFRVNEWWLPTWFGHLLLYGLAGFVSYLTAQKRALSGGFEPQA